jgi:VanZ family protein
MNRSDKPRAPFVRWLPAAAATAGIAVLSLLPARVFCGVEATLPPIPAFDKIVHAGMYAALTATGLYACAHAARGRLRCATAIALAATLYGLVMELCQGLLTTSRHMDLFDGLANATGAFLCAAAFYVWPRLRGR